MMGSGCGREDVVSNNTNTKHSQARSTASHIPVELSLFVSQDLKILTEESTNRVQLVSRNESFNPLHKSNDTPVLWRNIKHHRNPLVNASGKVFVATTAMTGAPSIFRSTTRALH